MCRLDTPFPDPREGGAQCGEGEWDGAMVWGSPFANVTIGDTTVITAVKAFGLLGHGTARAAGIGRVSTYYDGSNVSTQLEYGLIDGKRYGTPLSGFPATVSSSASPMAAPLDLHAFPSPTPGPITLTLDLATPQPVELAAFDALGRRVWHTKLVASDRQRVEVDASAWAPGLYVVRALAGDARETVTVVRR